MSKVLMTPDPHYITGYAGYCPQLKYTMGRTYGQLTGELLTRPDVKHSRRLVLQTGHVPSTGSDTDLTLRTIPDSKMKKAIPGYTGFVSKGRDCFACSHSETCHRALTEFHQDRRAKIWQQSTCQDLPVDYMDLHLKRQEPPLTPISNAAFSYKPMKPYTPTGNPYFMEDENPHKYFISGFTGHVPKSRFLFGKGYPITTNQALIHFRKQQQREPMSHSTTERTDRALETSPLPTIYPSNRGVVPSFTGHIPGYKFMYGHTFGQLSQNALEKSGIRKNLQLKS